MRKAVTTLLAAASIATALGAQTNAAAAAGIETMMGAFHGAIQAHRSARAARDYGYDDHYGYRGHAPQPYEGPYYDDQHGDW